MKKNKEFNNFKIKVKEFAKKEPVMFVGIVIFSIIAFCWILSSLEIIPEAPERTEPTTAVKNTLIEPGDSMNWIGMNVIYLSRSLRKEFKIPKKIKGVLVLDEGLGPAQKYGIKSGDVIVSIGQKPIKSAQDFADLANNVKYSGGIFLDVYRDGKKIFITIPFDYQYGPLMGTNKGSWQLGSPVFGPAIPYSPMLK
ncbi:MAG: PDZ domain-containing protein [Candidatus Omnitrophica bacterium]|nr:PDZ domain-containing protein [Candidatus Omnitrophota bacterium]